MSVHAEEPPPLVQDAHGIQYAPVSQLGKGGFAICYRGEIVEHGKQTGRAVALKIVKSKLEPAKMAQKFVTELQLHSKLVHPNVVEFYRAFSYGQSTYVVLQLCENGSLADALRKRKFFTMPEIRRFIIQTCGAVKYLHHRNIIHRDLKTGNIFLDGNMNVKVGDFGLAAVLVSQNDLGARRTTMCGTPNYLAPEIIDKGGKGHNEKVDIWAIGIIAYTLAVGKAPFHAAKREDIYKKLQKRDYSWPDLTKHQNDISKDLRDLVGSLLVHENERPSLDQIVSHQFFKMTFVPVQLDSDCTKVAPRWPNVRPPSAEVIQQGYSDSWFQVCRKAGVGEYAPGKTFPVHGGRKNRSIVRDCEKEIAAGRQPIVPLPADIVYEPFPERDSWASFNSSGLGEVSEEKIAVVEERCLTEVKENYRYQRGSKRPVDQFQAGDSSKENEEPVVIREEPPESDRLKRVAIENALEERKSKASIAVRIARGVKRKERTFSSKADEEAPKTKLSEVQHQDRGLSQETRIDVIPQPVTTGPGNATARRPPTPDDPASVPLTDPVSVLARVSKLRDSLAQALNRKNTAPRRYSRNPQLPFVSKWVDYSRKHGVGYILNDGSIGCIINGNSRSPVTYISCRNGYFHLSEVQRNPAHMDKAPFEYYAECDGQGIKRVRLEKERKRTTQILWLKFGRYMCQQLGQMDTSAGDSKDSETGTFIRFYQRLGSTGVWGYEDGTFQFNFSDHTKLVLSSDGKYCSFTCLPIDGVKQLSSGRDLDTKYIKQRSVLSYPLQTLLFGSQGTTEFKDVMEANRFREKLEFIIRLIDQWVAAGGLGRLLPEAHNLHWEGFQLSGGKKLEWITVGRSGGDAVL